MRVWLGFAIIFGTPTFLTSLRDVIRGKSFVQDNLWLGFAVPLMMVLWGLLFPRIGAALSFHERKRIVRLLERVLVAGHTTQPGEERGWRTSLDGWFG
jgi:hypothetical protein